jgi:hypothetical protein
MRAKSKSARERARNKRIKLLADQSKLRSVHQGAANEEKLEVIPLSEVNLQGLRHTPLLGTIYERTRSRLPLGYITRANDGLFIDYLRSLFGRKLTSKEDNELISPAIFNPDRGERYRAFENIEYVMNVWLDFEDGDLSPHEFAQLFPTVKMVATNSYRHIGKRPRFRAVMFADTPMTVEAHRIVVEGIEAKILNAGYWTNKQRRRVSPPKQLKESGLDWSKRVATSLFYLPCQAENSDQSFFTVYDDGTRQPISVEQWVANSPFGVRPEAAFEFANGTLGTRLFDQAAVQAATDIWRSRSPFRAKVTTVFLTWVVL